MLWIPTHFPLQGVVRGQGVLPRRILGFISYHQFPHHYRLPLQRPFSTGFSPVGTWHIPIVT